MTTLDTVRTGALSRASVNVPKTPVATWKLDEREVCLFQTSDRLEFSAEGPKGKISRFVPDPYQIDYAINLIVMFHSVIKVLLETQEPHPSCFLPKFCTEARDAQGIQVALFGHVDKRNTAEGEIKWMRWGISDVSRQARQVFEVNDPLAEEVVRNAPRADESRLVQTSNKKMVPAKNHYAMTTYAKRFAVVLERDGNNVIQNIKLVRTSIFDKNVSLDESSGAISLVSMKSYVPTACSSGHAMIAYEGVEKDDIKMHQFLRYIHIKVPHEEENEQVNPCLRIIKRYIQSIKRAQAEVEILDDETCPHLKWDLLVGATRSRPNTDIEHMIKSTIKSGKVDFAILGTMESTLIAGGGGASVSVRASWDVGSFIYAMQLANEVAHRARLIIRQSVLGPNGIVAGIARVQPRGTINPRLTEGEGLLAINKVEEAFKGSMALANHSLAKGGAFVLLSMCVTYIMVKSSSNRQNCLDWVIRTASLGGIKIRDVPTAVTPNRMMEYLRDHPSCIEVVQPNIEVDSSKD